MTIRTIWEHTEDAFMQCSIRSIQAQEPQSLHCLRLYFILSGTMNIRIGTRSHKYGTDEITLVNAHESFSVTQSDAVAAVFDLDTTALAQDFSGLWFSREPVPETQLDPFLILKSLLARYVKFNLDNDVDNSLLNWSMYYAVVHHLLTFFRINRPKQQDKANSKAAQIEQVARYIDQHYKEPLSLNELASLFYLSPSHLSRLFKQFYGSTFSDYLMSIRLQNCLFELTSKNISIENLSAQYGFPNSRSFISHFKKKFGITPGQYQKQHLAHLEQASQASVNYSDISRGQEMEVFAKYLISDISPVHAANDTPIKLTEIPACSASKNGTPLTHNFKNLTAISSAHDILMAENQEMLKTTQQEIGFRYIHFHGLFDDVMRVYGEKEDGTPELNFSRIDTVIDFLLSIGLRPFIELSYMPSQLASPNARQSYYGQSIISLPADSKKWAFLVRSFVLHLNNRYGRNEVASWPFSLWNLPDSGELLGLGNAEDYFRFYHDTWQVVKGCAPDVLFFSPSCMAETVESGEFIPKFLQLCRQHNCLPDLFQFHFYPIQIEAYAEGSARLTYRSSPSALKESLDCVSHRLNELPGHFRTLHVTEWNASVSHRELLSDTAFQSAYITKNILENYDQFGSLCYWAVADPTSDGHIARELFHGGLGLFTCNGIKKASYHALRLLSNLGNEKLASGDGYFITRNDSSYQILLYNYQHYSELYARGEVFDMTFTNRYTPFPGAAQQKFTLSMEDLTDSEYLLSETILNAKHGSSFDKWVESGALPLTSREDLEYLQSVSLPKIHKELINTAAHKLELSFTLDPHEVRLIEIVPVYR